MDTGCPRPARLSTPRRQTYRYGSNGPRSKRYSAATFSPPPLGRFLHCLESPSLEFVPPIGCRHISPRWALRGPWVPHCLPRGQGGSREDGYISGHRWAGKSSPHAGVQYVPQPVAQQIESEDSEEHRQPRNHPEPRSLIHEASSAIQHVPPRWLRRLGAQPKKAQGRLKDDGVRKRLHGLHDERSGDVRKDLASQNAQIRHAYRVGSLHILLAHDALRGRPREAREP